MVCDVAAPRPEWGGRVGRGGVGEKPFEGFASTGPAPKDLPFKKRTRSKRMHARSQGSHQAATETGQNRALLRAKAHPRTDARTPRIPQRHTRANILRTGHGIPPEYLHPPGVVSR